MISLPHKPILGFGTKNIQQFSSSISKVQSLQIPFFYFLLSVMLSIFWDLMHLLKENGILLLEFSFLINPTTGSHSQNDSWLMGISGSKSCSCERSWWKYQFWYDTFVSVGNYLPDNFDMNMIYISLSLYFLFYFIFFWCWWWAHNLKFYPFYWKKKCDLCKTKGSVVVDFNAHIRTWSDIANRDGCWESCTRVVTWCAKFNW